MYHKHLPHIHTGNVVTSDIICGNLDRRIPFPVFLHSVEFKTNRAFSIWIYNWIVYFIISKYLGNFPSKVAKSNTSYPLSGLKQADDNKVLPPLATKLKDHKLLTNILPSAMASETEGYKTCLHNCSRETSLKGTTLRIEKQEGRYFGNRLWIWGLDETGSAKCLKAAFNFLGSVIRRIRQLVVFIEQHYPSLYYNK